VVRDRDRLRGIKKFQLDIEANVAEITLGLRNEHRRRRGQPSTPTFAFSASSARASPVAANRKQAANMSAQSHHPVSPVFHYSRVRYIGLKHWLDIPQWQWAAPLVGEVAPST